jgi:hypothetical protein
MGLLKSIWSNFLDSPLSFVNMYHPIIQQTQIHNIKILFSTPLMARIPPKPNTQ